MSDPLDTLKTLVDQAPKAMEVQALGASLDAAAAILARSDAELAIMAALTKAAGLLSIKEDQNALQALERAIEHFDDVGASLERADNKQALDGVADDYRDLRGALRTVESLVRARWTNVLQREFQPLVTVGEVLGRIKETAQLGARMASAGQKAINSGVGTNVEQLPRAIEAAYVARKQVADERGALLNDSEVDAFFSAVANNEATLRHLTPAVLKRLAELSALDLFRIES